MLRMELGNIDGDDEWPCAGWVGLTTNIDLHSIFLITAGSVILLIIKRDSRIAT